MNEYWNDRTRGLSPYIPGEQPRHKKFIKLNTNENPYPPSPLVIQAIQKAANGQLGLYPDPACTELREAIASRYAIKPGQVFAGNGSDEILAFAFAAFFGREPVLFPDITYSFYPVYAGLWGVPYKTIPLKDDFSIDPDDYLNDSGGVVFPNPNAPTGMGLSLQAVRKIAEAALRNKRLLVLDEAYIAFADGIKSALPLTADFPNVLVVRTFSKEASLAGLRVGFAMGSEGLIEGLCRVRDSFNSYTLDRLALAGATAAINDASYYATVNDKIIATRQRLSDELNGMGFSVLPSQANFVFAAPRVERGKGALELFGALRERGILVRHFNKPRIDGFLRITIGTDRDMDTFLEACKEIIA